MAFLVSKKANNEKTKMSDKQTKNITTILFNVSVDLLI